MYSSLRTTDNEIADDLPPNCDVHSSSDEYAKRFSGELGQYFLDVQWELVKRGIDFSRKIKILDVGGGHGQIIERLANSQHDITILASSAECNQRIKKWIDAGICQFITGNFYELPFADKSFDLVICLRQVAHVDNHERFLKELCRVSSGRVIIDYAPLCSFNVLYPVLFWLKKHIEKGTRFFLIHTKRQLCDVFKTYHFTCVAHLAHFFIPMGFHRAINKVLVSKFFEKIARVSGLTRIFGSPVILIMEISHF